MQIISGPEVASRLDYQTCIPIVREAMRQLSAEGRAQPLREVTKLGEGKFFGVMPGVIQQGAYFGAKLVGVFDDPAQPGRQSHQGVVALFEGEAGRAVCIADAKEVTTIRTAAASAVATEALARPDAAVLGLIGCGTQARAHLDAHLAARSYAKILVWSRSARRAMQFVHEQRARLGIAIELAEAVEDVAANSDVVCTLTSSPIPILSGKWLRPGVHVNAVGASVSWAAEVDDEAVVRSRYFVESRNSALAQAGEYLQARKAGLITADHIVGEIGEVLLGTVRGRLSDQDITMYKSLGHIVQDLAVTHHLYEGRASHPARADELPRRESVAV